MSTIPHLNTTCQDVYIDGAGIVRRHSAAEPIATPLADLLDLASRRERAAKAFDLILAAYGDMFFADRHLIAVLNGGDVAEVVAALPDYEEIGL